MTYQEITAIHDISTVAPSITRRLVRIGCAVVVGLALCVLLFSGVTAADAPDCSAVSFDGNGSSTSPYEVSSLDQLQCVGHADSESDYYDDFIQTDDINAEQTTMWNNGAGLEPIGTTTFGIFSGSYDGQGHEIRNLYIDRPNLEHVGLFNETRGAISNLTITDASVSGSEGGSPAIGILTGGIYYDSITSVSVSGKIAEVESYSVGGVVGFSVPNLTSITPRQT
ncbi:MAG: hypothetical protein U5K37_08475 [Natrialbaceae archaeon]|nr:hypothetical protein [Natrialbaceae archaeon]